MGPPERVQLNAGVAIPPAGSIDELCSNWGGVTYPIDRLEAGGRLRRKGGRRNGEWEIMS
jgi:hypothetical protein